MEKTTSRFTVHLIRIFHLLSDLLESNTGLYHPLNSLSLIFLSCSLSLSHSSFSFCSIAPFLVCTTNNNKNKRGVAGPKMATGSIIISKGCKRAVCQLSCSIAVFLSFTGHSNRTKHAQTTPRNHHDPLMAKKRRQTRSARAHGVFGVLPSQNSRRTPRTFEQL